MANKSTKNQNTFNRWLNRYFPALIAVILAFFLFGCYLLLIAPKLSQTESAILANLEQQQNIYTVSRNKLASLTALNNAYGKIGRADLAKFDSVLPDRYAREELYGELEEMVARGGWILNSVTVADEDEKEAEVPQEGDALPIVNPGTGNESVGKLQVQVAIGSIDYQGFKNLVRMLETNLRLFDIVGLDFIPAENTASISLATYYYKK